MDAHVTNGLIKTACMKCIVCIGILYDFIGAREKSATNLTAHKSLAVQRGHLHH